MENQEVFVVSIVMLVAFRRSFKVGCLAKSFL